MSLFSTWNIAASGMAARRLQMVVISSNIANAETTRTIEGGPYKRQIAVFRPVNERANQASWMFPDVLAAGMGEGVKVARIDEDPQTRWQFNPNHPDAVQFGPKQGYVELPNINIVTEMTDFIAASRAYEAGATIIQNAKRMFGAALNIGAR